MKKLSSLLLLGLLILVAGCTQKQPVPGPIQSTYSGLDITNFYTDLPEYEQGETVALIMDIINNGGEIAKSIGVDLIGLPEGGDNWIINKISGVPDQLEPPSEGVPGETATIEWDLRAPTRQATDMSYPAEGVIKYDYASHTEALVRVANRRWINSLPENQRNEELRKLETPAQSSSSSAPILVSIKSARTSYTGQTTTIILDIQNGGGGRAEDDTVTITYTGISCSAVPSGSSVTLRKGQNKQIRCSAETKEEIETWKNVKVNVDLSYKYILRRAVELKVKGTPQTN